MRHAMVILLCAAMVLGFALPALFAQEAPKDPIELAYFPNLKVMFPHDKHEGVECQDCHHMWDGKCEIQPCGASGCHDVFDKKDRTPNSFYNMVHGKGTDQLPSCLSCHRDEAKKNPDLRKQLTGCRGSGCHP